MCEIDEMLVEDFIGAITHQQVAKGSGPVLFLFHGGPRLFGDGLEVFFSELIGFHGRCKFFVNALNLMKSWADATSRGGFCHAGGITQKHDSVFDRVLDHAGGNGATVSCNFLGVLKSVFPERVVHQILIA